jgi:release factor glutamine methyltransferase
LPTHIDEALRTAQSKHLTRLDAQLLLGYTLARPRSWVLAHGEEALPTDAALRFVALCERRRAGEPLAYLCGEREFYGLALQVTPAVLIPRPDTETLVDWALQLLAASPATPGQDPTPGRLAAPDVIDLGTGSGAIAIAVKAHRPRARLTGVDRSAPALEIARLNAHRHGLEIDFRLGDWWEAIADARFDLAVTNPPYIAANDLHLSGLSFEPLSALTAGRDGLDAIRAIVADAGRHLRPAAWLLIEHGWNQADTVQQLLVDAGFAAISSRTDIEHRRRCTGGRWPASPSNAAPGAHAVK